MGKRFQNAPKSPEHLTGPERAKFRELARLAIDGPGLSRAELELIELAAVSYCRWLDAKRDVDANGLVIALESAAGEKTIPNPAAAAMNRFHAEYVRRLVDLRLVRTPTARPQAIKKPVKSSAAVSKLKTIKLFNA